MRERWTWARWLGAAWVVVTAIYFHVHFAWVFVHANRDAITTLFR
jgi:hypothetical protein